MFYFFLGVSCTQHSFSTTNSMSDLHLGGNAREKNKDEEESTSKITLTFKFNKDRLLESVTHPFTSIPFQMPRLSIHLRRM